MLPEFLNSLNKEFIAVDGNLYQVKVELVPFEQFDITIAEELMEKLDADPVAQKALDSLNIHESFARMKKFAVCNFGGFDNAADIVEGGLNLEHYNCGLRGQCPVEGKLCKSVKVANGFLTPREVLMIKLVSQDKLDKDIADMLNISINTVNNHMANIHTKTGLWRPGLATLAIEKNL